VPVIPPQPIDLSGDAGPPIAYVVSRLLWAYVPTSGQWYGGISLPSGSCPPLDELALDSAGRLFGTGNGNSRIYRVTPAPLGCKQIGNTATYPTGLAFVPKGAVDPSADALVGYLSNGSYVRIDTTTGAISTVTANALGGYIFGDLATSGTKGFVAVSGGDCVTDCIFEIDLATGQKVVAALLVTINAPSRIGALAHWGGRLFAWTSKDTAYRIDIGTKTVSGLNGPPGYVDVAYRGAASNPLAPTQ